MANPPTCLSDVRPTSERLSGLDQFRAVTSLLSLATSINNDFSNLTPTTPAPASDLYGVGRSTKRTLDSMASILVQDTETIACTVSDISDNSVSVSVVAVQKEDLIREEKTPGRPVGSTTISDNSVDLTLLKKSEKRPHADFYSKGSTSHIKVLTDPCGSYWEEICSDRWGLINPPAGFTLANHAATLEAYLEAYRTEHDVWKRHIYFEDFTCYMISRCMRKLRRRATHRLSNVLVELLSGVSEEMLATKKDLLCRKKVATAITRNDRHFYSMLRAVRTVPVEVRPDALPPLSDTIFKIGTKSKLLEALGAADKANGTADIYNEHTFTEFHRLLVAIITGYREAFGRRPEVSVDEKLIAEQEAAKRIQLHAYLLWRISGSSVLKLHFDFLAEAGFISLKKVDESMKVYGVWGGAKEEVGEGEEDMHPLVAEDIAPLYVRWTRLLVDHLSSLDYLSNFVKHRAQAPIKITLLAVRASPKLTTRWDSVLASAFERVGRELDDATTQEIKEYICSHATVTTRAGEKGEKVLTAGGSIFHPSSGNVEVCSKIHCEAVLASLVKRLERVRSPSGAWTPVERTVIGVSRPWCPVCNVLLSVLNSPGDQAIPGLFDTCGFHSIMSTTELPPWLPNDVIESMLLKFSHKLYFELDRFTSRLRRSKKIAELSRTLARVKAEFEAAKANEGRRPPSTAWLFGSPQSKPSTLSHHHHSSSHPMNGTASDSSDRGDTMEDLCYMAGT